MSATGDVGGDPGRTPSEEELREAYEAQLKQLRVEHILIDNVVSLINLGMRRTGLAPGTEAERDPAQVRLAVDSIRALLPQLEQVAPGDIGQIRDALSQLQLAYVRIGGGPEQGEEPAGATRTSPPETAARTDEQPPEPPKAGEPGPAQRSGRLWIPGS